MSAFHILFELIDAHEAQDHQTLTECFTSLATLGASGKVSGLMARLSTCPRGTTEKLLAIFAQFAKASSNEAERDQVIDALRVL